ncbi:amidohydrolase family protein [Actinomyces sp. ZJ308]|uniref:amidohydrolase family protein n=1 Tax=Actinomyces sp. ZJ308 TaxID=2708342 RepID=UPI001AB04CC6|nr:amidohydrolase family protein [Actinomyces sp. ZJ308]
MTSSTVNGMAQATTSDSATDRAPSTATPVPAAQRTRLICVEEHALSAPLARASGPVAGRSAPYLAGWGSRVTDGLHVEGATRPHVVAQDVSARKLMDLGQARLDDMDAAGIDVQVLSIGGFPQLAPPQEQTDLTRRANDLLAGAVAEHPDRFAALATLPWHDPDAAAAELRRAVTDLGMRGTLLNGRPGEAFLDDSRYDVVLAALAELGVPIYLHPGLLAAGVAEAYYSGFDEEIDARLAMFGWGWHHEAGVGVVRLILSGAFERHPGLQVMSGHWGEMVPFFLRRLDDALPREATGLERTILETYRDHVSVTPSGMLNSEQLAFCIELLGAERILFSTDYPYQSLDGVRDYLDSADLTETQRAAIAHGNAERLLGL